MPQMRQLQDTKKDFGLCHPFRSQEHSVRGRWLELRARRDLRHTAFELAVR